MSKIERSMWRDGKRRRSPRITAMDACKESHATPCNSGCMLHQEDCGDCKGQPSRTRTRNKRKLEKAASNAVSIETKQGGDSQHHKDYSTSCGKSIQLPDKHILELILDTLQRRDISEIFAEPVDPSEVEDYYKIVEEPMDFGTMRAKLHEGMYQNIEQFEHDVFLIPTNAMHFNSRGSAHFRQARAIYELAKKIFHVLRTDPENIEVEFSGARRRSIRKAMGETKASKQSLNPVTGSVNKDISSKGIRSLSGPSVLKRSKGRPVINVAAANIEKNYYDFYPDARKNRRPQSVEADRRCTYRPWRSPFDIDNTSVGSTIYSNPRPILINQQDISYKESLMLFVKDLGPTAQIIAKKKLKGWLENSATCRTPSSNYSIQAPRRQAATAFETAYRRFPDSLPGCHSILTTSSGTSDLSGAKDGDEAFGNSRIGGHGAMAFRNTEMKGTSTKRYGTNVVRASKRDKVIKKDESPKMERSFSTSKSGAGDLHSSVVRKKNTGTRFPEPKADTSRSDDNVLPVVLALEHSRPNASELKSRNKKNSTEPLWLSTSKAASTQGKTSSSCLSVHQATAPRPPEDNVMSLSHPSQFSESKKSMPLFSGFTFDMPFLKAQLNQMNHTGQDGFSKLMCQRALDTKGVSFEQVRYERALDCIREAEPSSKPFLYNYTQVWPSPNPLGTSLTLQL